VTGMERINNLSSYNIKYLEEHNKYFNNQQ